MTPVCMRGVLHRVFTWRKRKVASPETSLNASPPEHKPGWFYPQSADELLATPLRQQLMGIIRQRTSMSPELFDQLYRTPVARFAERVQQLPASEYHHHAYPGGLLDHSLEVMAFAAKLRQRHLLPVGAAPEDQAREAEAWTAGILYAALLHDAGKVVADIEAVTEDNQPWYPWLGPPRQPYRLKYRSRRDYQLHPVAGCLLVSCILPDKSLSWLAGFPELHTMFLCCVSGHYERGGVMAEVVQDADRASVAQYMGAYASAALAQAPPSLAKQVLTALRELVRNRYKLNNPNGGSDGWLTGDALWLVSKTTADNIRAWLLQQGITGVPENNIRLFDEMQSCGLIVATPEGKAVWCCDIYADSGWTPGSPLTLLRLSPARLWEDAEAYPPLFAGRVVPVASGQPETTVETTEPGGGSESLTDITFSLFADSPAEIPSVDNSPRIPVVPEAPRENTAPVSPSSAAASVVDALRIVTATKRLYTTPGQDFMAWLKNGIAGRCVRVNDTLAPVHMVDGRVFLVTPGIFKLFVQSTSGKTGDEWRQVQKQFQKLGLHYRDRMGINIHTCEVKGARKRAYLRGYLIENAGAVFGDAIPEDNPYLRVQEPG